MLVTYSPKEIHNAYAEHADDTKEHDWLFGGVQKSLIHSPLADLDVHQPVSQVRLNLAVKWDSGLHTWKHWATGGEYHPNNIPHYAQELEMRRKAENDFKVMVRQTLCVEDRLLLKEYDEDYADGHCVEELRAFLLAWRCKAAEGQQMTWLQTQFPYLPHWDTLDAVKYFQTDDVQKLKLQPAFLFALAKVYCAEQNGVVVSPAVQDSLVLLLREAVAYKRCQLEVAEHIKSCKQKAEYLLNKFQDLFNKNKHVPIDWEDWHLELEGMQVRLNHLLFSQETESKGYFQQVFWLYFLDGLVMKLAMLNRDLSLALKLPQLQVR